MKQVDKEWKYSWLGFIIIDSRLKFNIHVEHVAINVSKSLFLKNVYSSYFVKLEILLLVYHSLFNSRVKCAYNN